MQTAPKGQALLDDVMSNFDGVVNDDVEAALRSGGVSHYPGRNFHGTVWFEDGEYHCQVMQYTKHVATMSAATCDDLRRAVSDEFGYQ